MKNFSVPIKPDWEALVACIQRRGTPRRVHCIELFLDSEIKTALAGQFGLNDGINADDRYAGLKQEVRIQRFLGYDYVRQGAEGLNFPLHYQKATDTAAHQRANGRQYVDENRGPITSWEEFEKYHWPQPEQISTASLEWLDKNLPDDMCIIGSGGFAHFAEYLNWLMGYETLCYALFDQRDLVQAIADRLEQLFTAVLERMLAFPRVKLIWGSDDMGFRSGTLISPDDLRAFVFPGHRKMAAMAHAAGRPYLLHACGQLTAIMEDLIADVKIDAKHSFEDTIEDVRDAKQRYGNRIALLGGIDLDFLCRSDEAAIRARVHDTLDKCLAGGGYCLGTGNSVANYISVPNYLTMLDEGRRYRP
ncbi:MAG: hypothetical protein NT011_11915 [Kiritimatiellaeota bacterium]|nr:hypothetical protein [Kiritimatiellota bacterium]